MFTSNTEFFNFKKLIYTSDSLLVRINLDKKKRKKWKLIIRSSFSIVSLFSETFYITPNIARENIYHNIAATLQIHPLIKIPLTNKEGRETLRNKLEERLILWLVNVELVPSLLSLQ